MAFYLTCHARQENQCMCHFHPIVYRAVYMVSWLENCRKWLVAMWTKGNEKKNWCDKIIQISVWPLYLQVAEYFLSWASLQSTNIYPTRLYLSRSEFCLVLVNSTIRLQFKNHNKTPKTFCTMLILLKMELFWFRINVISGSQKKRWLQ